jgi:hypothetical protein
MKQIKVSGWVLVAALVAVAAFVGAESFTDVNSSQYWGKTGIPALTAAIDANFAMIEDGLSGEPVAATTLSASGATTLSGSVTVIGGGVTTRWDNASSLIDTAAIAARTEWTVDGKYAAVGGDATTGLMVLKADVTAGTNATETVAFATVFGAAPTVVCTYTEDPGDVPPIFVTSVTASNFVANITADKNYGYIAVGTRP